MFMQKQSVKKYQFPRSLGLNQIKQTKNGMYTLSLGYSDSKRQQITVDKASLHLLRSCLRPKSIQSLSKSLAENPVTVEKTCKALTRSKILKVSRPTPKPLRRYDRHLLFFENAGMDGIETQNKISRSKVALIGMGGIGNWVALNLIGSGLKELRLIDFDTIEETNLTRQVLFSENDIGESKVKIAGQVLASKNSKTSITQHDLKIKGPKDLIRTLSGIDMVVLSADRPEKIHDWVDQACMKLKLPYINLGYRDGIGVVGPMTIPGKTSCYQCFKPNPSLDSKKRKSLNPKLQSIYNEFDSRYQAPSFGSLNAWVSTLGSIEVLKYLGQFGTVESLDVEINLDPLSLEQSRIRYKRDNRCWNCNSPNGHYL